MGAAMTSVINNVIAKLSRDIKRKLITPAKIKLTKVATADVRKGVLNSRFSVEDLVVVIMQMGFYSDYCDRSYGLSYVQCDF